ncbi:hypothetical protein [Pseudoalteromonas denitrificans]|jgi:hypothetical protein|uniref:Uncharacterized protein n=1 Tax=Pseudoalteromonas denitrificans DSM 6059 TaxID=1123010 RepID=A0A1I1IET7_9GAMM|nr:hypothetical protein [Pseudoalteromonas denitrificans]SFC31720.1 hypothetical protein SAMN02745724_01398 [Pseudoalteromonas denitrificans DSM 6059]
MMENLHGNKFLAGLWFSLSAFVALASIVAGLNGGLAVVPGILGLSGILMLMARQKILRYQLEDQLYKKAIQTLAFMVALTAGLCSISI